MNNDPTSAGYANAVQPKFENAALSTIIIAKAPAGG